MAAVAAHSRYESYRHHVRSIPQFDQAQEARLGRAWQAGDGDAGRRLVEANLRTVVGIAWEYRRWGTPMDDLVQQGSIGLLKAAARFDPNRDNRLRSYASYWIRAEIRDYVVRGYRMVRLGATRTERRAMRAFRTSDVQSVDELVALSGMPPARCELLWPLLSRGDRSTDASDAGRPTSMSLPGYEPNPEELAITNQERALAAKAVAGAMATLSPRERDILRERMMGDEPRTLEEIGRKHGVSRERIRQLEKRAKEKMRQALQPLAS